MRTTFWGSAAGLLALALGACATPSMGTGLVQLTPDSYRLSRVDGVGRYADVAALKAALLEEANDFARGQGKVAVPVASHEEAMRTGHLLTADLEFRLAAPGTPQTAPPVQHAAPAPFVPLAGPAAVAATPAPAAPAASAAPVADSKPSLYNELVLLDDLRQRGILTDAEFQALKTKLLAGK